MGSRRAFLQSSAASVATLACGVWPACADNAPGVAETEIKIGQTMPYSGSLSAYGLIGKTDAAYFAMINESGGVNGRKITPLLQPFGCAVKAYDPWISDHYMQSFDVAAASLDEVLATSRVIVIFAGVTSENQGFLGKREFELIAPGSVVLLMSRAGVVDFPEFLRQVESGRFRAATDVFPVEPARRPTTRRAGSKACCCRPTALARWRTRFSRSGGRRSPTPTSSCAAFRRSPAGAPSARRSDVRAASRSRGAGACDLSVAFRWPLMVRRWPQAVQTVIWRCNILLEATMSGVARPLSDGCRLEGLRCGSVGRLRRFLSGSSQRSVLLRRGSRRAVSTGRGMS